MNVPLPSEQTAGTSAPEPEDTTRVEDAPAASPAATAEHEHEQQDAPGDRAADGRVGPIHRAGRYESVGQTRQDLLSIIRRYVLVTKPRIIELLLITTVPTMVVAAGGWPDTWLVIATVLGGTMSAGSANALNNVLDRDIDQVMARTSARPTATEQVSARGALILGLALGVAGFVWLTVFVNLLAAGLATFAILFYVFVYTIGLKRRTPQAVVIGGIAGCMPVMTAWAAFPEESFSDPRPWLLFGILFVWQAPHFWALAMKYREDYAQVNLPMLPVVTGNDEATRHILLHSYLLAAIALLSVTGMGLGWVYDVPVLVLTALWLVLAHKLRRERTVEVAMRLFHYSTIYLSFVFIAAAIAAVL